MTLHEILQFLEETYTGTEVFQIHLGRDSVKLKTVEHLPDTHPRMIRSIDYQDVEINKPPLEDLQQYNRIIRKGIENEDLQIVFSCTKLIPYMPPGCLVIDGIQTSPPRTYRLTLPESLLYSYYASTANKHTIEVLTELNTIFRGNTVVATYQEKHRRLDVSKTVTYKPLDLCKDKDQWQSFKINNWKGKR